MPMPWGNLHVCDGPINAGRYTAVGINASAIQHGKGLRRYILLPKTATFLSFQMQLLALEISHLHLAKFQSNGFLVSR